MHHLCEHTSLTHLTTSTKYTRSLSIGINILPGFWHIIWACGLSTSAANGRGFTVFCVLSDVKCQILLQKCTLGRPVDCYRCTWYQTPKCLTNCCMPVFEVSGHQYLHLASHHKLNITQFHRSTFGTQAFSVASPTVWNSLPDSVHDPAVESERFRWNLKTHHSAGH